MSIGRPNSKKHTANLRGRRERSAASRASRLRPGRSGIKVIAVSLVAGGLAAALLLPRAWRETQLREAYLPQLEVMARADPYDGRLLALLGARQIQAGEASQAAATLERALNDGEKTEPVWLSFAAAKAASGERRAAAYLQVARRTQDTPELAAAQARCQALGTSASGMDIAQAICPQGPEMLLHDYAQGSVLNGIATWWGRSHPEQSGFETRREWATAQPEDAQAQLLWAQALIENRRPREAVPTLQHALALAPNSPAVHLTVAQTLESRKQLPQAALQYVACLKLRPNQLTPMLGLGRTLLALQLPATALKVYTEATRIAPKSADAWVGRGLATAYSAGYVGAVQPFDTAARLAPARTDFSATYAQTLMAAGRWAEAEAVLRRRLAGVPADAESRYMLGMVLLDFRPSAARRAEAEVQTREALRLDPQLWPAQQQFADILLRQGKPQEAIIWLQNLRDHAPVDVSSEASAAIHTAALAALARAYRLIGRNVQADQALAQQVAFSSLVEQATRLKTQVGMAPLNIGLHQQLASLFARAGQTAQAQREQQIIAVLRSSSTQPGQTPETLETIVSDVLSSNPSKQAH